MVPGVIALSAAARLTKILTTKTRDMALTRIRRNYVFKGVKIYVYHG